MSHDPNRESLFKEWDTAHRGILLKFTRSYARSPVDAADLMQELRLQLWNSTASYAGQAKASTWIYRVCLNTALSWHRNTARRLARIDADADLKALLAEGLSPLESAGDRELLERLYVSIHAMPETERGLILMSLDGLAYREIAEITGMTENHVGVCLTRARKQLAALMKGITDELE
jgi:RNA polymerase sigma factor (sigma-70 family)